MTKAERIIAEHRARLAATEQRDAWARLAEMLELLAALVEWEQNR